MRTNRASRRLLTLMLPIAAAVLCAAIVSPGAAAGDRLIAQKSIQQATTIEARVVRADGSPVEGAVVITSAGGKGVSGHVGAVRFAVDADPSLEGVHVTAVASLDGVNHSGSVRVALAPKHMEADAGVIVLSAEGECDPAWLPTFGGAPGVSNTVWALTVFDDGSGAGPALHASGIFTAADGVKNILIAKWDGASWSPLGSGMNGLVRALTVFDDGSDAGPALYACGDFTTAGGVDANFIAKWDGSSWSPLGKGMNSTVSAMTVFDDGLGAGPALYAGGEFTTIGGVIVNNIAKWDGQYWSPLGSGVGGAFSRVGALAVFDDGSGAGPALYAGGSFITAGGVTANNIAKWDGASWSTLSSGVSSSGVGALAVFDDGSGAGPALYAGGNFTTAGGVAANNIAKWDGATWSQLGSGMSGTVLALTVYDDGSGAGPALYAGGGFTTAGGVSANRIAKWNGVSWSPLGSGMNHWIIDLIVFDDGSGASPALYAGGFFTMAGGVTVNHIAKWDGPSWSPLGSGLSGVVRALAVFDDGSGAGPALYAGGDFTSANGIGVNHIAKWDGASWSPLGNGMSSTVWALTVFDDGSGSGPALYAGGDFTTIGGVIVNNIAKWDGQYWSPLGSGMSTSVRALVFFDDGSGDGPALYAGGSFTTAGGVSVNGIAKWDGAVWSNLGSGMCGSYPLVVRALTVFDDGSGAGPALYAGGSFTTAGGVDANFIAKWDVSSWSPLGSGMNSTVSALTVFDDGLGSGPALYAGGSFTAAGGAKANRIAKWNGSSWSPLGNWMNERVWALTVFDDGFGSALYAGYGSGPLFLTAASGVTLNRIAKWDGATWSPLGSGMNSQVHALTVFDDGFGAGSALYAGGTFTNSTTGDSYIAKFQGCPIDASIPGDLNGDGVVNAQDLGILLGSWGPCPPEPDPCPADINGDGVVNAQDLGNLLGNWGATAP